jgi:hypothetical protein
MCAVVTVIFGVHVCCSHCDLWSVYFGETVIVICSYER